MAFFSIRPRGLEGLFVRCASSKTATAKLPTFGTSFLTPSHHHPVQPCQQSPLPLKPAMAVSSASSVVGSRSCARHQCPVSVSANLVWTSMAPHDAPQLRERTGEGPAPGSVEGPRIHSSIPRPRVARLDSVFLDEHWLTCAAGWP